MSPAGYSGTPLVKKLGLKEGMSVRLYGAPADYWGVLGTTPEALGVAVLPGAGADPADFSHLFATEEAVLRRCFASARERMVEQGVVWASWPKASSGVASEVGRGEVMAAGQAVGLVDVKVCAVDETWSGLKFVIPLSDRRT